MKARRGVTLVEVMLAGSIAVLLTLACLEGVIVSTRIAHENSQLLAAEAYAWDTAWRWLNKPYDVSRRRLFRREFKRLPNALQGAERRFGREAVRQGSASLGKCGASTARRFRRRKADRRRRGMGGRDISTPSKFA